MNLVDNIGSVLGGLSHLFTYEPNARGRVELTCIAQRNTRGEATSEAVRVLERNGFDVENPGGGFRLEVAVAGDIWERRPGFDPSTLDADDCYDDECV